MNIVCEALCPTKKEMWGLMRKFLKELSILQKRIFSALVKELTIGKF